jgi:hypothetical protein
LVQYQLRIDRLAALTAWPMAFSALSALFSARFRNIGRTYPAEPSNVRRTVYKLAKANLMVNT